MSLTCRNISWTVGYPPWWWLVRLSTLPSDRTTTSLLLSSVTSTSSPHPRVSPVSTKSTRRSTSNWPQWLPIRKSIYVFVRVTAAGPGICSYILSWHSNCFSVSMSNGPGDITGNVFFLVIDLPHLLYNVTLSFFSNLKRLVHMLLVQQNPLWLQEKIRSFSLSCPNFIGVSCMYSLYLFHIHVLYVYLSNNQGINFCVHVSPGVLFCFLLRFLKLPTS